jgi:hypothetical protein
MVPLAGVARLTPALLFEEQLEVFVSVRTIALQQTRTAALHGFSERHAPPPRQQLDGRG